jgi:hypothetical protein
LPPDLDLVELAKIHVCRVEARRGEADKKQNKFRRGWRVVKVIRRMRSRKRDSMCIEGVGTMVMSPA